jgi:hypothetical protein
MYSNVHAALKIRMGKDARVQAKGAGACMGMQNQPAPETANCTARELNRIAAAC